MQFRDGLMKLNSRLVQSWNYRFKWMKEVVIMKYKSCPHCGAKVKTENFCTQCGQKMTEECNCWVLKRKFNCQQKQCPGLRLRVIMAKGCA